MGFSRRWANSVSSIASRLFFLLIIFQVPLFRVPCRSGICMTPVQVTSSQLIASEILPVSFVKILLYPGAFVNAVINGLSIPNYNDLLEIYNLTRVKEAPAFIDLTRLEILTGSYFSVAGAIHGLLKRGRLSLVGVLLLLWGLIKEVIRQRYTCLDGCLPVQVSPIMLVALFTAFSSIQSDARVIIRSFQAHQLSGAGAKLHHAKKRKKEREMKRLEWNVNYNSKTVRSTKVAQEGITTSSST